jgi:hypothetical protein
MSESTTLQFIGLDVHRGSVAIAVARPDGQPAQSLATVPNQIAGLIRRLQQLGPLESLRCCSEAGPTGFNLARRLILAKIDCQVIAPSLIPVQPGDRIKINRCDAHHRARSGGAAGQSTTCVRIGRTLVPPLGRHFGADARMESEEAPIGSFHALTNTRIPDGSTVVTIAAWPVPPRSVDGGRAWREDEPGGRRHHLWDRSPRRDS